MSAAITPRDPDPEADCGVTELPARLLHDLRSPLNQIIGYSEILAEEAGDDRRQSFANDVANILSAGRQMLALIEHHFTALPLPARDLFTGIADGDANREAPPDWIAPQLPAVEPGLLLIVDDDPANRDVLSRRLKLQGHEVITAGSGREALQLVGDAAFDLVLLDILMPDMDGYEVLRRIKADPRLQTVPVIMISALNEVQSVIRCIEAGAEDYLTKPFDPTLLRARVGASLEKKRGRDRESVLFEQLQDNYKRLQELEKLRDDMRNMIVHDLRTPLTSVIVGVEMLEKHGELNPTQREMMTIAAGGGRTLLSMINDLLDVEKMEAGSTELQYEALSAEALVAGAIGQVTTLAEEARTAIVSAVPSGLSRFDGDAKMLGRTLVNLIANAIKFTPAGTVTITALDDAEGICFVVRDTGVGIPPEAFERIFEKFGQLRSRDRVGTGLGLAFCRMVVEAHGGRIGVESSPGIGSIFSFTIPRTARSAETPSPL